MRYTFLFFLLLNFFNSFGQTGDYFLSHFSPTERSFGNVCFDIAHNQNGVMYFATRSGVLEFDGRNWDLIAGNGAVYSLQVSNDGTVYWSGAAGYGIIAADDQGFQQIKTLSSSNVKDVFASLAVGDNVYFLNDETLIIYSPKQEQPVRIVATNLTGAFVGVVEILGSIYLNTEQEGLFKVENNQLTRATLRFSDHDEILFATPFNNRYLIGLANNRVFLCGADMMPREIFLEARKYVEANVIVSGKWLNEDLFVLGTLRGGMVFVNASTGKTEEIINYWTGLPDNEVYALMTDKNQSVWAAHEYGFTRVSPHLPFRCFSHYDGLQGNLLCALTFEGKVYVGTSSGLYTLVQEQVYDEVVTYVDANANAKANRKQGQSTQAPVVATPSQTETTGAESKKRGFLWFLKKKRNRETADSTEVVEPTPSRRERKQNATADKVKKTERILRSANYSYKKVQGIDAKVTQMAEAGGHLIAVGSGGAFEVQGLKARPILNEPSSSVFVGKEASRLFISTYKNEMKSFEYVKDQWIPNGLLDDLDDRINFIFQGKGNDFWFCATDKVYRIEITEGQLSNIQTLSFPNSNFDDVKGLLWNDKILLANSEGFFRFNDRDSLTRIDSLGKLTYYFATNDNIWFRDLHNWKSFGQKTGRNLHLLNLYQDLRFVTSDESSENLWLITGNNELYKFFGEETTPYYGDYPLILKGIRNANQKFSRKGKLEFNQEKSSITFEVVQPDYLAASSIEYRYRLNGLEKTWSEWSGSYNIIDFPYLPPGDYSLMVQARDIFGNVKELDPVAFEVYPPYWKRTWFYALEFVLFASLVVLSFRLSNRYHVISRLLSLLTIILLIQFIQTVIGETFETRASPVMDFFVQVLVALLILPVEGYLRNLLLRSLEPGSILHHIIPAKGNPEKKEDHSEN